MTWRVFFSSLVYFLKFVQVLFDAFWWCSLFFNASLQTLRLFAQVILIFIFLFFLHPLRFSSATSRTWLHRPDQWVIVIAKIYWFFHLFVIDHNLFLFSYIFQQCNVCDNGSQRSTRMRSCANCSKLKLRHSVHHNCYHRRRSRAIKQIKRCTFATTTTEIPNSSEENPHLSFKSQSSNSSNGSSIRIIE